MSKSLDIQRMKKMARWNIAIDKPYLIKTTLACLACVVIIFQFQNLTYLFGSRHNINMSVGSGMSFLLAFLLMSGGFFFSSFDKNKDGIRSMMLVPASNLEKFTTRYLLCVILYVAIGVVSIIAADILQYLVGLIIQRDNVASVSMEIIQTIQNITDWPAGLLLMLIVIGFWVHTVYLLGSQVIRPIKLGWVVSTLFIVLLFIGVVSVIPSHDEVYGSARWLGTFVRENKWAIELLFVGLSVLNYWLAYRLFCRRQMIGKLFIY